MHAVPLPASSDHSSISRFDAMCVDLHRSFKSRASSTKRSLCLCGGMCGQRCPEHGLVPRASCAVRDMLGGARHQVLPRHVAWSVP